MRAASRPPYAAVLTAVAALAVAGCGRDPEQAPAPLGGLDSPATAINTATNTATPTTAPTAAAPTPPEAAYRAWLDALAEQAAQAACARHAPQLTIDLRLEAILLKRAELGDPCVDFVAVLWEQPDREYDPVGIEVTQVTDEDALLAVDFPGRDQTVRMIRQNTRWLVEESVPRAEDAAGPQRWLAAWCDLELAMVPSELTELMGDPSGTYTIADGGEPQLYWAQDQYDFRAYLDTDPPAGQASDLVGDYDRLTADERAGLSCPELR